MQYFDYKSQNSSCIDANDTVLSFTLYIINSAAINGTTTTTMEVEEKKNAVDMNTHFIM